MEKSCGVVLFNGQKVLLLQYATGQKEGDSDLQGHWDFPKGHVDKGETEIETAIRELEEETGIKKIILLKNFRKTINYTFQKGDRKIAKEQAKITKEFEKVDLDTTFDKKVDKKIEEKKKDIDWESPK